MKLSIVVPVYNMAADGKLARCLDSLLAQKTEDLEIIAVDDKSTDDSLSILREYEKANPGKVKVIASPVNGRQGAAKNLGMAEACGEWLGFMDSDDWAHPEMYTRLLQKAEDTGADIVGCDYLLTEGGTEGVVGSNNDASQTGELDDEKRIALILKPGSMVVKIYKRAIFADNNIVFPEGIFYEDNAVGELPFLYAEHFERVDEPLYYYYQHNASTVHTINISRLEDRMKAAAIYKQEVQARGFYERYPEAFEYKIFELGYRNTLYSYLQTERKPALAFTGRMRDFLLREIPEIAGNPYYLRGTDAEVQKLTRMHLRNNFIFFWYYRLLGLYRKLRYGRK